MNRERLGYRPQLDGIRGIAVSSVLGYHLFGFPRNGGLFGVSHFFVLSGFLITTLLLEELESTGTISLKRFFMRRALRLLPLAYTATVLISAVSILSGADSTYYLRSAIVSILYIGNYFGLIFRQSGDLAPALSHFWTLAVEEQFYLLWPVLLLIVIHYSKIQTRTIFVVTILGIGIGIGIRAALLLLGKDVWAFTISHLDALLLGALLSQIRFKYPRMVTNLSKYCRTGVLLVLLAINCASSRFDAEAQLGLRYTMVAVLGVIMLLVADGNQVSPTLTFAPLVRIGKISYGLYILHWPIFLVIEEIMPSTGWLLRSSMALIFTIICSEVSFRWFESRFLGLKQNYRV